MDANFDIKKIRNFSIIAHIDHGKSTLADRLLEKTGTVDNRNKKDRILDTLELEQERGITIKLQTARMEFIYSGSKNFKSETPYILNLVDTPGHVDFSYEVSRSLAASEGAILLVDATQGIQAQTFTTVYKALEYNLKIIPVVNKIDMPNIDLDSIIDSMVSVFGFPRDEIIRTSGKTGEGVEELLNRVIEDIPCPANNSQNPPRALIYDSFYHEYKGVVALVKVIDGSFSMNQNYKMYAIGTELVPLEIGYLKPELIPTQRLNVGEIGYIASGLKDIKSLHVGDTVCLNNDYESKNIAPLPDYKHPKPMVYASLYPVESNDFQEFKDALEKLALNDASLIYEKQSSPALGTGFLCGFLGLLHMEVTQERLSREFDMDLITTSPSVEYRLEKQNGEVMQIHTVAEYPDPSVIKTISEPWIRLDIFTPEKYIGPIMELTQKNRGAYVNMSYIFNELFNGDRHVTLSYEVPTSEIISGYFDKLKSISQGYASMDYEFIDYRSSDIVKVNIFVNHEIVEALSFLSHSSNAEEKGKKLVGRLSELIPRQQIQIPIQAAIGQKIFARETIRAYRKDVLAKMSGGDITRKIKLLEKQKKGKKKLKEKMIGNIHIPQEVFVDALKID